MNSSPIFGLKGQYVRVAPNRRSLEPGMSWQQYDTKAIRIISKEEFKTRWNDNRAAMEEDWNQWERQVCRFTLDRAAELGMEPSKIHGQLVESPDESKALEVIIWNQHDTAFIWAIYIDLLAQIPSALCLPNSLPMIRFFPGDSWGGTIAEIFDANVLATVSTGQTKLEIPR